MKILYFWMYYLLKMLLMSERQGCLRCQRGEPGSPKQVVAATTRCPKGKTFHGNRIPSVNESDKVFADTRNRVEQAALKSAIYNRSGAI